MSENLDSSSEDEDLVRLKESIDTNFISDNLFKQAGSKDKQKTTPEIPKSLRPVKEDFNSQFSMLKVTPEFQKYVAKQLAKILEASLQKRLSDLSENPVKRLKRKRIKDRVKLLSNSEMFLDVTADLKENLVNRGIENRPEIIPRDVINEEEQKDRLKSVVVNGNYILSQEELKTWAPRNKTKYNVTHYKQNKNCQLILKN